MTAESHPSGVTAHKPSESMPLQAAQLPVQADPGDGQGDTTHLAGISAAGPAQPPFWERISAPWSPFPAQWKIRTMRVLPSQKSA